MEDKTFLGFILNKTTLFGGLIFGVLIPVYTFIKKQDVYQSLTISLAVLAILLLLSLYSMFRDIKKMKKELNSKSSDLSGTKQKLNELETKHNAQSIAYSNNIKELNKYKLVAHVVETLINTSPPETKEGKKIINTLKYSVETKLKDSDN